MSNSTVYESDQTSNRCPTCSNPIQRKSRKYCSRACYESSRPLKPKHPIRGLWSNMTQRCSNPKATEYYRYGGRGITVCEEWKTFEVFAAWVETQQREPGMQLDRKDNELGYSPDNCKFSTRKEQQRNRSGNRLISAYGETKTISEWVEDPRCSLTHTGLTNRLQLGISPEQAISCPPTDRYLRGNRLSLTNEQALAAHKMACAGKSSAAIARELGTSKHTILRLVRGKSYRHLGLAPIPLNKRNGRKA